MATINVTILGESKTITYPDSLEGQFLPLCAEIYGYPTYVPNPAAAGDPTQPPMVANTQSQLDHVLARVAEELVGRVKNLLLQKERAKAEAAIQAAVDARIGSVTVQ